MSPDSRRRQAPDSLAISEGIFARIEQELAEGYLEVEITGMTMRRLVVTYSVLLRNAWAYTLDSVRSLVRPTPAH